MFKKAELVITCVAKMVINDFQRGRLPYFVNPKPYFPEEEQKLFDEKCAVENAESRNVDLVDQNLYEISWVHDYVEKD